MWLSECCAGAALSYKDPNLIAACCHVCTVLAQVNTVYAFACRRVNLPAWKNIQGSSDFERYLTSFASLPMEYPNIDLAFLLSLINRRRSNYKRPCVPLPRLSSMPSCPLFCTSTLGNMIDRTPIVAHHSYRACTFAPVQQACTRFASVRLLVNSRILLTECIVCWGRIRISAVRAIRFLVPLGAGESIRDLAGFRESNIIVFKEFYDGAVRINYMVQCCLLGYHPSHTQQHLFHLFLCSCLSNSCF